MLNILFLKSLVTFETKVRFTLTLIIGVFATLGMAHAQTPAPWLFAGGDLQNSRARLSPAGPQQLNAVTAPNLTVKWVFNSQDAILATPTVEQGGLYVTDAANMLYKLDPETGAVIWSHPVSYYTGSTPRGTPTSRSSPAIGGLGEIVLGDTDSATVFAVDRTSGELIWKTVVDANQYAFIHGSAVIYNGIVYIGVTSREEGAAMSFPSFVPTFRGSVVALDEATGKGLWKFYTVPLGYTGASIWNTQPVVFTAAHSLIVATGNNYSIPLSVAACILNAQTDPTSKDKRGVKCLDAANQVDSIVSLDLTTGKLNWSRKFQGPDTYTGACLSGFLTCPNPAGPDVDFASSPNLVGIPNFTGVPDDRGGISKSYLLGAAQNNGAYWGINPLNGGLFWGTPVGVGGMKWGSAINADTNAAAFVALNNSVHANNLLAGVNGVSQHWNAGAWGSIDLKTGKMIWQLPAYGMDLKDPTFGSSAPGAISYSNHVAFAGSSSGYMTAFDASTGAILWTYDTGGSVKSAPAIFNDTLYWGGGKGGPAGGQLYAFSIAAAASATH